MTIIGIIEIYDRRTGYQHAGAWLQEADALPPGITKEIQNLKMRLSWEEEACEENTENTTRAM